MEPTKKIKLKEWRQKATELFGENPMDWKFKCVSCGNVQSGNDFKGLVDEPMNFVFFSCLGRFKKGVGCDWTLGGLLGIQKLEIIDKEGKSHPSFEFAEA